MVQIGTRGSRAVPLHSELLRPARASEHDRRRMRSRRAWRSDSRRRPYSIEDFVGIDQLPGFCFGNGGFELPVERSPLLFVEVVTAGEHFVERHEFHDFALG
jgi:hypothetical protein